jgi:hypothetical protein
VCESHPRPVGVRAPPRRRYRLPGPAPGRPAVNGLELPGQLWRLGQFRARNPGVTINRDAHLGFWQAWIPVSNGGTVITRYLLPELLDRLEELLGAERGHGHGGPGVSDRGAGPGADPPERT